jgi:methionyl-tRNA formyltransferase
VRIAVAATPAVAIPTLDALIASEHELISVITKADAPAGRGRALHSSPVADWADTNEVKVFKPVSKEDLGDLVKGLDLVVTIGYGLLIPAEILEIPRHGFINLHFSLLPRWRGAAPVQRAVEAGDSITGVTVFQLDAGMDTGPIYQSAQIPLPSSATSEDLFNILAKLGVDPVVKTLDQISRGIEPSAQSKGGITRANKLSKEEGQIDWNSDAESILRKIRAFDPNPGAWSQFRGQILKINKARLSNESAPTAALRSKEKSIFVGTSTSALELLEVTPAGKSQMLATSWANGARLSANDLLQ